ncbi:Uncharacterized protein HZ326_29745 [Fusarium oxysporum f. sp. albedinis]|nr:Uncharacterized protein HZ326_29745 [Fusarium oxysporum f. sp. albedinis]
MLSQTTSFRLLSCKEYLSPFTKYSCSGGLFLVVARFKRVRRIDRWRLLRSGERISSRPLGTLSRLRFPRIDLVYSPGTHRKAPLAYNTRQDLQIRLNGTTGER